MNPILVVVLAKGRQFFTKVLCIPKEDAVKVFTANRSKDRWFDSRRCAVMSRRGHGLSNEQNKEGEGGGAGGFSLIAA